MCGRHKIQLRRDGRRFNDLARVRQATAGVLACADMPARLPS